MGSRFLWFVFGAATGAALMLLMQKAKEDHEVESFEEIADELAKRLEQLEGTAK